VTGWMGFSLLVIGKKENLSFQPGEYTNYNIWSFLNILTKIPLLPEDICEDLYFPIQEQRAFYIILFAILMIIGTIGFFTYLFKSVIKKDDYVFEGMMGTFSRYHFIPLVCASALFLGGYTQEKSLSGLALDSEFFDKEQLGQYRVEFAVNLVFSIFGLNTLIFVKMQTKIENPLYVVYSIKDGLYSCLIALFTYCLFYSSYYIGLMTRLKDLELWEDIPKYKKACGIVFSIFIGVINLCVSFVLKDFILPIINFIIYLGLAIKFFDMDEELRKQDYVTNAEGTIEIVVTVLSAVVFAFLIYLKIIRKH
jgi:hypothetical protein